MKTFIYRMVSFCVCLTGYAQQGKPIASGIGIGTREISPAAALHVKAENKGVLIPIIDLEELSAFQLAGGPEGNEGLLIYSRGSQAEKGPQKGFYFWNGTRWEHLVSTVQQEQRMEDSVEELKEELHALKVEMAELRAVQP